MKAIKRRWSWIGMRPRREPGEPADTFAADYAAWMASRPNPRDPDAWRAVAQLLAP